MNSFSVIYFLSIAVMVRGTRRMMDTVVEETVRANSRLTGNSGDLGPEVETGALPWRCLGLILLASS